MPTPTPQLRLFGLDLPAAWQEIHQAWRKVLDLPLLAWLGPKPSVLLHESNGATSLWEPVGTKGFVRKTAGAAPGKRAAFQAVELPEDIVLRKQIPFPPLSAQQLANAVELEAQGSNPFAPADLVWGYGVADSNGNSAHHQVELVLASRRCLDQFLASHAAGADRPEVWVKSLQLEGTALILRGYGEQGRMRAERRGWYFLATVACVSLMLLVMVGVTPSLQLREQALQAMAASARLVEQARPQVAKREALLAVDEQLQALRTIVGNRPNPLRAMHMLTNVLGDDTVLQRLQIEGRNVLIVGQTPDAAAMMQKLSAQTGLKSVRAPSAATRPPGSPKEVFQVEFTIDDESLSAVPAVATAPVGPASEAKP